MFVAWKQSTLLNGVGKSNYSTLLNGCGVEKKQLKHTAEWLWCGNKQVKYTVGWLWYDSCLLYTSDAADE